MATRLLSRRQIVLFGKDLRTYCVALHQSKNFSSEGSGDKRHPHAIILLDEQPDGPKDLRMPLPGNVGFPQRLAATAPLAQHFKPAWFPENLTCLTNYDRQIQVLKQSAEAEEEELEGLNTEELEQ